MKKTSLGKILVSICIILSFYNVCFATVTSSDTTKYGYTLDSYDFLSVEVSAGQQSTSNIASTTQGQDGKVNMTAVVMDGKYTTFTVKESGVYTIDVTGMDQYPGEDLYYSLLTKNGQQVRLAAYDDGDGNYRMFSSSSKESPSSTITVYLKAGQQYNMMFDEGRVSPGHKGDGYTGRYNIGIKKEERAEGKNIIQTDYASQYISTGVEPPTTSKFLEPVSKGLEPSGDMGLYFKWDGTTLGSEFIDDIKDTALDAVDGLKDFAIEYIANPFEETICELLLAVGDLIVEILNNVIGEDATITALVYNNVDSVNPNFFDSKAATNGLGGDVKSAVSKWYDLFNYIAIAIYLLALLSIGVQILFRATAGGLNKGKEMAIQWVKGLMYIILIPYVLKMAFSLNEELVSMLGGETGTEDFEVGGSFNSAENWSPDEIEFRSPEYVSKYTGSLEYGSEEMTQGFVKKETEYRSNIDLMRLMRVYAGVTKKFVYVIIWYILIGQLLLFIVQYYKRFFMIAFLIAIFPLISIFNGISIARGQKPKEISKWMTEIMTNIFIQSIHAIIYTIITAICVEVVKTDIQSSATLNWIIIIVAINFVSEGEGILRKIVGAMGSTAEGTAAAGGGVKGAFNTVKKTAKEAITGVKEKN